jgi:hypothetical protein
LHVSGLAGAESPVAAVIVVSVSDIGKNDGMPFFNIVSTTESV